MRRNLFGAFLRKIRDLKNNLKLLRLLKDLPASRRKGIMFARWRWLIRVGCWE